MGCHAHPRARRWTPVTIGGVWAAKGYVTAFPPGPTPWTTAERPDDASPVVPVRRRVMNAGKPESGGCHVEVRAD